MARKKYQEEHENADRWLVSYADFITLLFAFFVVMYALSSVNEGKYRAVSESLLHAFGRQPGPGEPAVIVLPPSATAAIQRDRSGDAARREREELARVAQDIQKAIAPLADAGKVRVTQSPRGVTVEMSASALFATGEARLGEDIEQALKALARVLKQETYLVQVEGHTDSKPISNRLFASNWELSALRASTVVRLLADSGIAPARLTAVGRAATRPVESNDTAEGRLRNRRVTVLIMPSRGAGMGQAMAPGEGGR